MSTPHRTEINQANAQHSTGPKTKLGKQRSSQNALRHGLTSQMVVIPQEDPDVYDAHVEGFYREHQPQGATETALVQLLADTTWRLLRVATMEANIMVFDHNYGPLDNIVARITAIEKQTKSLANLSLHSQRLSRQFEKTLAQLRDLQQSRQREEPKETRQAKVEPHAPSEDGFVFSTPKITTAVPARAHFKGTA